MLRSYTYPYCLNYFVEIRLSLNDLKKIELVFPVSDLSVDNKPLRRGSGGKMLQKFVTSVDDIANWFNKYEIESLDLWISSGIETDGVLKLAISAKGEGGFKLTLNPKKDK